MELDKVDGECILFCVIVNAGMGSKVLKEVEKIGVYGGTIFLGKGTVKSHILELLSLDQTKKEIVLIVTQERFEDLIHDVITENFHLEKPNHGIAFSMPTKNVVGIENCSPSVYELKSGGKYGMEYEAIFTVVDRGLGQEVVDAATSAGARGATIINARGSGIHEDTMFFSMRLEPEKEIVMIIIERERADKVVSTISETMRIDEPGKGIIFGMDINRASGILKEED